MKTKRQTKKEEWEVLDYLSDKQRSRDKREEANCERMGFRREKEGENKGGR